MKESLQAISRVVALLSATSILFFTSCVKNVRPQDNIPSDRVMRFEAGITDQEGAVKSEIDNDNIFDSSLYLWISTKEETPTVICENEALSYNDDALCWETASATLLWKDSRTPIDVTAANFTKPLDSRVDYLAIDISSNQNTGVSDLLYFKGTVDPTLISDVTEEETTTDNML